MKKKLVLSVAVISLAGASYLATSQVFAQSSQGETSLVQKIATKFNLNQNDVQAVFDEHRNEQKANMQKNFEDRLTQLVKDGKITEDQKAKILQKFSELKSQKPEDRDALKDMTPEERKAAHEKKHEELKSWAEANGIDLTVLFGAFGPGKGMGRPMMH